MCVKAGDEYSVKKYITIEDIELFAKASGDYNPIHLDDEYAKNSIFKRRVAHGMLSASYISAVLGTTLPGEGSIYLSQNLKFLKPVFIGDTIFTMIKVISVVGNKCILKTTCCNQDNKLVIDGQAEVLLTRRSEDV